jgi:hypothetical protein
MRIRTIPTLMCGTLILISCTASPSDRSPVASAPPVASSSGPTFGDGSVSFHPTDGWTLLQGGALSACFSTSSYGDQDLNQSANLDADTLLGCRSTAAALPPDGVLVTVSTYDAFTWASPGPNFPKATLPPTLEPSTCGAGAYEVQPRGTTECHVWITANNRLLEIRVWFGTESPTPELMATAQQGLNALEVAEPASLGNDIAFEPAAGWYDQAVTPASGHPRFDLPVAWTSNVELPRYSGNYLPAGPSSADIARLPNDGIIVSVMQPVAIGTSLSLPADYRPLMLNLQLSDATLIVGAWEGMADEDVSRLYLRGVVNGRPIIMQAFFHTTDPSRDLIRDAQTALNRLVIVPTI